MGSHQDGDKVIQGSGPGSVCVSVSQVPGSLPASPNFLSLKWETVIFLTPKAYYEN